jgi:hypothetical protein
VTPLFADEAERRAAFYAIFKLNPDGAKVLEELKVKGFFFTTTLHANPHITHAQEGARSLLLHILRALEPLPPEPDSDNGEKDDMLDG